MRSILAFLFVTVLCLNINLACSEESLPQAVSNAVDGFSRSLSKNLGMKVHFKNISYIKTSFNNFYHVSCKVFNVDEIKICSLDFYTDGLWAITAAPGAETGCADALFDSMLFINLKTGFDESVFWKAEANKIDMSKFSFTEDRITFGNAGALVKVAILSDFFCPGCYDLSQNMNKIYDKYKDKVVIYFKHHPYSDDNPQAMYISVMYEELKACGLNAYARLFREIRTNAVENGAFDMAKLKTETKSWMTGSKKPNFLKRFTNKRYFEGKIKIDYEEIRNVKLEKVTPVCLVNGKLYTGCTPLLLDEAISREINKVKYRQPAFPVP